MLYQFQIDNRPAGRAHKNPLKAVEDAINEGYGIWCGLGMYKLNDQASIVEIFELSK